MSQKNPIRVFVTHNWHDQDDYLRVFEYLESARNFFYRNTGTPDKAPQAADTESVREELRKQINAAEVVIALASLYLEQPDLTIFQMNYAKSQKKPVVLMRQFGLKSEPSKLLLERADEVPDWEERGLVDAIRRLARGENTARFDTVEFNPDEFKDFKLD
ncbi:MAG TPA: TIR domain-containing protein [Steroidobacteraceae bacterium]|nr:TIR domain-containing protein [Steroidobacteraceae bacterium]